MKEVLNMINAPDKENVLDSAVGKAIVGAIRNPFDKQVCTNCSLCGSKGAIKYYCGKSRNAVSANGGCSSFKAKAEE